MGLPIWDAAAEPPEDLHALIASFQPDALRLARRLVRSQSEAEDLAQTALMKVLARADAISDPAFVRPYLLTTVRNLWRNQLRAGTRCEPSGDPAVLDGMAADPGPEDATIANLDADTVRIAMETLPAASRELIALRYLERLDYTQIAAQLGVSGPAARQRVHRAREQLRAACFSADTQTASKHICQLTRLRLGRYARASLSRRAAARVALHLHGCDECRECFDQLADIYGVRTTPEPFPESDPEP